MAKRSTLQVFSKLLARMHLAQLPMKNSAILNAMRAQVKVHVVACLLQTQCRLLLKLLV